MVSDRNNRGFENETVDRIAAINKADEEINRMGVKWMIVSEQIKKYQKEGAMTLIEQALNQISL